MIDLHLHLDGSLTPQDLLCLSRLTGVALPTQQEEELRALLTFDGRGTLNDYLTKFDLPLSVMQSAESVYCAVSLLGKRLAKKGYRYAEVRFAPSLHTKNGATIREIVQGAVKGLSDCELPMGILLCCMRGGKQEDNLLTVESAAEFRTQGVLGVDLAGAEALYPTENYQEVFSLAGKLGLQITIHAGEAAGEDSIRAALDMGAKRIGHGVAAKSDDLLERLKKNDVLIECCPTSNLQTGAVTTLSEHPIKRFLSYGIPVALCADNMTVSDTDVFREWEKVKTACALKESDLAGMTAAAFAHRFSQM